MLIGVVEVLLRYLSLRCRLKEASPLVHTNQGPSIRNLMGHYELSGESTIDRLDKYDVEDWTLSSCCRSGLCSVDIEGHH
jgi:hypothetical protein